MKCFDEVLLECHSLAYRRFYCVMPVFSSAWLRVTNSIIIPFGSNIMQFVVNIYPLGILNLRMS